MKIILVALMTILLTGCLTTVQVRQEFPRPPDRLMNPPIELIIIHKRR